MGRRARPEFGPGTSRNAIEALEEKLSQVYAVLQNLLEGEAFVIIRNTEKGNGLEGWRKLNRRYDPATGAKKSSLLRHILTPGKCKLEELNEKVEQWMELLNRYEARRGTGGQQESLPDDIKMSILDGMCPPEIERHLQLNRPRFMDFDNMHSELATYLEPRVRLKLKIENLGSTGKKDDDAMDVEVLSKGKPKGQGKGKYIGAFSKGKGKGSSKGKGKGGKKGHGKANYVAKSGSSSATAVCFNCGKPGHFQKDCKLAKGKGKAKPSKGGKKGLNGVEQNLEISMLEAMDESTSEDEPLVPNVGVPNRTGDLAKRRYRRLLGERSEIDWRSIPISRCRQRCAAMAEAQLAFPTSVGRMVARRILESEGLDSRMHAAPAMREGQSSARPRHSMQQEDPMCPHQTSKHTNNRKRKPLRARTKSPWSQSLKEKNKNQKRRRQMDPLTDGIHLQKALAARKRNRLVEAEQHGGDEEPREEETELGGKSSTERDTEAEA